MKLAPISAPQWASRLQKGDYHMVLAPWLFTVADYAQYYNRSARPPETHVILDNGAFEGIAMSPENLTRAAAIARADEVVLADVRHDASESLKTSYAALRVLYGDEALKKVMFVPHGKTKDEWRRCLGAWMSKWEKEGYGSRFELCLGLASHLGGVDLRAWVIEQAALTGLPMHLLGLPNVPKFLRDDLPRAHAFGVRGMDTSLPFVLACGRQLLTLTSEKENLQKPEQYAQLGQRTITLAKLNIAILRYWLTVSVVEDWIPIEIIRQIASEVSDSRRIYSSPEFALRMCAVPRGRYEIQRVNGRVSYVRPIGAGQKPQGDVVGVYYGGKPTRERLF